METSKSAATSLRIGVSVRTPAWLANRARKSTTEVDPRLGTGDLASPRGEIAIDGNTLTLEGSVERARSAMESTARQGYGKPNKARPRWTGNFRHRVT
jgi:hypothetical protein